MSRFVAYLVHHWKSRQAVVSYLLLAATTIVGFVLVADRATEPLYSIVQPVQVTGRVPGVKGPAIWASAPGLPVFVDVCNSDSKAIVVLTSTSYSQINKSGAVLATSPTIPATRSASIEPGCHKAGYEQTFESPLTPGMWRQATRLTATQPEGTRTETHVVVSEPFVVVAG